MIYTTTQLKEYAAITAFINDVGTLKKLHEEQPQLAKELEDFNALVTVLEVAIALHKQKVPVTFLSIVQYLASTGAAEAMHYELNHSAIMGNIEKKVGEVLPIAMEHEYLVTIGEAPGAAELRITVAGQLLVVARKEASHQMRSIQESALRH